MTGKKYGVLASFLLAFLSQGFSQDNTSESSSSYDIRDSSLIPARRIPQHNEFLNNAYPFPARPRDQWEIGIKGGMSSVSASVRAWLPTFGAGIHVRKSLGYTFSVRAEYDYLTAKGLNWQPSYYGYASNPVLKNLFNASAHEPVFYNYKTTIQELSIQGVVNLNNIRFHKAKSSILFYLFGGIGATTYATKYNLFGADGARYDYSDIITQFGANGFTYANRKAIKSALKSKMDGSFETVAQRDPSQPSLFGVPFIPVFVFGLGTEIKLTDKFNIAIEDKVSVTKSKLIDGQEWQETGRTDVSAMTHNDAYNFLSVGLNYNLGKRAVEPLWWINPLDYAYSELNAPRHMKLPKPVLDDADGDGVTDQFDHEPNTPAGCPVDTHGVSRDTDGDGVPDCKDKELITPTQCQPVDADGVGKCPDPACCKEINAKLDSGGIGTLGGGKNHCSIGDLPSIVFKGRTVTLNKDGKALASTIAEKMRNNPACKVAVIGYGESSKTAQQLSWDRVNEVIKYLVEKEGVNSDRFIFRYGQTGGDENTIDIKDGTGEEGPNTVPAPHPNLRKK
jgi:outer membrane protein OmpA-like peptidoglycan-associated protein